MTTIFRFAIQTAEKRHSEAWSFFHNKKQECLYATRTSMRDAMKVSFHKTGACHVKSYENGVDLGMDHIWRYEHPDDGDPVHIMRVVYDLRAQRANFPLHRKIKFAFEDLSAPVSIYLDVFFIQSDAPIEPGDEAGIFASHHMGGRKWVYFSINVGPRTNGLPDGVVDMTFNMGDPQPEGDEPREVLTNVTGVWFQVPTPSGAFVAYEASAAEYSLKLPA